MVWFKEAKELRKQGMEFKDIAKKLNIPLEELEERFAEGGAPKKEGKEERKPTVTIVGEYYIISSGKRQIVLEKEKLKSIKDLYCGRTPLTVNQICRKLDIPRRDFMLVKTAFGITHDDVPFLDEEVKAIPPEELAQQSLENFKNQYFIKLQQMEFDSLKKEVAKYRKQDFFYDKVIKEMAVPQVPLKFRIKKDIMSGIEGQLILADWHTGLKTVNYWNKYNLKVEEARLRDITEKTLMYIKRHNIAKMHVMNLGDILHGMIHVVNRVEAEVDVIEQLRISWNLLSNILVAIAAEVEEVKFYSVHGNHPRLTENKKDALDRENLERLIPDILRMNLQNIPNIKIMPNKKNEGMIEARPCGHLVYGIHGDKDKPLEVTGDLTLMLEAKPLSIFTAHTHHKEVVEDHKVDVIMSRSLCGVEGYAEDIRKTSKAGQSLYIWNKKGLECIYDMTF